MNLVCNINLIKCTTIAADTKNNYNLKHRHHLYIASIIIIMIIIIIIRRNSINHNHVMDIYEFETIIDYKGEFWDLNFGLIYLICMEISPTNRTNLYQIYESMSGAKQ